jgi:O-antigen/teichoic acid export membrane protein
LSRSGSDAPGPLGGRFGRDVAWNIAPIGLLAVVGLGLNFAIARWWGTEALGVFSQVTSAYIFFSMAASGGLNYSVLRAIAPTPEHKERVSAIVVGGMVPTLLLGALVAALFVLVRGAVADLLESEGVAVGMLWAAPGLFCFAANKLLLGVVNGLRRMRAFAVYTSLRYLLIAAGLLIARARGMPGDQLGFVWTFSEGVLLIVLIGELLATVTLRACSGWTSWAREHLVYGARGALSGMLLELNAKVDIWMLGATLSDELVGIYSLAAAVAEGVYQLAVVLQNNFNPLIAHQVAEGRLRDLETMVAAARRWVVPAMLAACAMGSLLYPHVVHLLTDRPQFDRSAASFWILMAGIGLASAYLPFMQTLLMGGRPGWHTLFMTLVVLTNVAGNAVFIPFLEIEGAALGTAVAFLCSALYLRWMVDARLGARI